MIGLDKTEILKKMEERRIEEEVRVKEQVEASKRKLEELENRLRQAEQVKSTVAQVAPVQIPDTLPTFKFGDRRHHDTMNEEIPVPSENAPLKALLGISSHSISVVSGDAADLSQYPVVQSKGPTWRRQDEQEPAVDKSPRLESFPSGSGCPPSSQDSPQTGNSPRDHSPVIDLREGYDNTGIRWVNRRQNIKLERENTECKSHTESSVELGENTRPVTSHSLESESNGCHLEERHVVKDGSAVPKTLSRPAHSTEPEVVMKDDGKLSTPPVLPESRNSQRPIDRNMDGSVYISVFCNR